MSSFRKVHIVPEEKLKSLQECATVQRESLERVLRISLLLARINAYDDFLQIRSRDGQFIPESNVINFIEKLENDEPALVGEDEFLQLLKEANVPLSLIKNENIKSKLLNLYNYEFIPVQPVVDYTQQQYAPQTLSSTQTQSISPQSSNKPEEIPTYPDPHWTYHDYFTPQPPKRRKRKSKESLQWKQM